MQSKSLGWFLYKIQENQLAPLISTQSPACKEETSTRRVPQLHKTYGTRTQKRRERMRLQFQPRIGFNSMNWELRGIGN